MRNMFTYYYSVLPLPCVCISAAANLWKWNTLVNTRCLWARIRRRKLRVPAVAAIYIIFSLQSIYNLQHIALQLYFVTKHSCDDVSEKDWALRSAQQNVLSLMRQACYFMLTCGARSSALEWWQSRGGHSNHMIVFQEFDLRFLLLHYI